MPGQTAAPIPFREPNAARAGGYVLALAGLLVAVGLSLHPLPRSGFDEQPSQLSGTPIWGPIHAAIAIGFVLCVLGGLLYLSAGGPATRSWLAALAWGALTVGMIYFTGVALVNGWVMHPLALAADQDPILFDAMNHLVVGFGWLGNPLFLFGLTGVAVLEARQPATDMPAWLAYAGVALAVLSWGRGVGSATGLYFLNVLVFANV